MPSRPLSLHVHFLLSLILLSSSSSLTPNLSPQQAHSGLQNPVMHQPPFSSCLLCGLIDGRTLTSCPPSISPTYPALEGPLSPPTPVLILHPHSPISPLCSLFIKFPFGSRESNSIAGFIGELNSWPKGS